MTRLTLTLHEAVAERLRMEASSELEIAGVLIVGVIETAGELRFLGREFHPADPAAYVVRTTRSLELTPAAYMPALARAHELGATAIFVHSHPDNAPLMSWLDDGVDEALRSVFQIRTGSDLYASLVLRMTGEQLTFSGRAWRGEERVGRITLVREFGDRFRFSSSADAPAPVPPPAAFDRQVRAFGDAIQNLLRTLHVGIVGGGGTGSAMFELLVRSGVGEITIIDPQELTDTNVTRVFGSGMADVGRKKVAILEDHAARIGLDTTVHAIDAKVSRPVLEKLLGCDLIFACTDDDAGRLDLARLAYWCLIPVFDLAALLDSSSGVLRGIYSRVDLQLPSLPCVMCSGLVDMARVQAEEMAEDELEELRREGYAPELDEPDPAVIAYTTMAAAMALNELLVRLTGVAKDAPGRSMCFAHDRRIQLTTHEAEPGHWCGDPLAWGAVSREDRFLGRIWP